MINKAYNKRIHKSNVTNSTSFALVGTCMEAGLTPKYTFKSFTTWHQSVDHLILRFKDVKLIGIDNWEELTKMTVAGGNKCVWEHLVGWDEAESIQGGENKYII